MSWHASIDIRHNRDRLWCSRLWAVKKKTIDCPQFCWSWVYFCFFIWQTRCLATIAILRVLQSHFSPKRAHIARTVIYTGIIALISLTTKPSVSEHSKHIAGLDTTSDNWQIPVLLDFSTCNPATSQQTCWRDPKIPLTYPTWQNWLTCDPREITVTN